MARQKKEAEESSAQSLKSLTKSSVWDVQENDIIRMIETGVKDPEIKESLRHYIDIIRCAFEILDLKDVSPQQKKAYGKQGYKVCEVKADDDHTYVWGLRTDH